jgi:hypothetical protein
VFPINEVLIFLIDSSFFDFRVADYGYTKLKELFEALPHVVQIMGEGSKALITLAHRAQVRRINSANYCLCLIDELFDILIIILYHFILNSL